MNKYNKGILCVVLSAVMYGTAPLFARYAYEGGANGISLNFLRSLIALPILFVVIRFRRIPLTLTKPQLGKVALSGMVWYSVGGILLYVSYSYTSTGLATTLHFVYPILVAVASVVFYKEKLDRWKVLSVILCGAGIALFIEPASGGALGIVLALLSGVAYTFHIIYLDKSGLRELYYFKYTFYACLGMTISVGLFGLVTGTLRLNLTPKAWLFAVAVSLLSSVGGLSLFQAGVSMVGATTAAVLSTFEPITSVVLGILFLQEELSPLKLLGCGSILVGVILTNMSTRWNRGSQASAHEKNPEGTSPLKER